ncbi:MAG: metallophosphoesterase, partial [Nonlabens sp.]|nr:metallophosphoesterase [Nonlabens sp.]
MHKNYILLSIACLTIAACSTYKPKFKDEAKTAFPQQNPIDRSFFLIGDAGLSPDGGKSNGILALEQHLQKEASTKNDYLVFLGDNIYPTGMPKKDDEFRQTAENHLDAQIEVAKGFKGSTIFIPGNHDWYNEGLENVEREKKYIEDALNNKDIWAPKVGCPLKTIEVTDDIELLLVDSQWYLAQWDKHPTINDDCDQIKTREQFFLEIESELKKNQDKTIIFALHHPVFTNGVHGGQYNFTQHLFPTSRNIPLPILGSLTNLVRTNGGISAQDKQNERYQQLVNRLTVLAKNSTAKRLIFTSGHEHTLQYIENDGIKQIVSGSGSKKSYVTLGNDGLFAYAGNGFARLDVMKDGSSWVRYYSFENGASTLLYTVNAIKAPKEYLKDQPSSGFPAFAKASIYEDERVEKSSFFKTVWGNKYRDLYGIKINAKVANLDTLYGGLKVERAGGGHQTRALRLTDKNGKEYNLRALKKSAVQFLQTVVFKSDDVATGFEETATEDLLYDFYTAAHPYASLAIPDLADAVGVYHENPEFFYVPKQEALGKYNEDYGDELYMIVERPEESHKDLASFGKADDLISTADVFENLRKDEKYSIDEPHYIKSRMFDMLIGDWDRHQDQWRWAEYEQKDGKVVYKAIPRDRDQAFSNFDGAAFATLRTMVGITKQFATYDSGLSDVKWFNTAATYLDRSFSQNSSREEWIKQATYIQENLSDAQIENAFKKMPELIYEQESTATIIAALKTRRDNMVDIAGRYYDYLASLAIVTGTDKDDIIIVDRINDGETKISIYRNKGGEAKDLFKERTFYKNETKEIWIYALDDDDIIKAIGNGKKEIKVRIIGGQNNDIYELENGDDITIYDHKSKDNTYKDLGGASLRKSDSYERNLYDPNKNILTSSATTPAIGFNPDDGFKVGLQYVYTVKGFNRNPNTRQHKFSGGYYFATEGYDINYQGIFAGVFNKVNLLVTGRFAGPTFAENYFGFGNESVNQQDEFDFDYNRVRVSEIAVGTGVTYNGEYGSNLTLSAQAQGIQIQDVNDRFITDLVDPTANPEFYERQWFLNLLSNYNYESYDNKLNPTRGMLFDISVGGTFNKDDLDRSLMFINPKLEFFNAINERRNLVVRTMVQGQINIGSDYEFYQSAQLGQNTGLRGYRTQRFSGQRSFAGSADLRYSFKQWKTGLIPIQTGILVGGDV